MADNLTSLNIASIPVSQPLTPEPLQPSSEDVRVTHLTYDQALDCLGPYLDAYLKTNHLSRTGGVYWDSKNARAVRGDNVISIESVQKMADYLHAAGNPDPRAINDPDWPKDSAYWKRPTKIAAAVTPQVPTELTSALAIPGVNLEVFHAHGAPSAGDLQAFIDGKATPSPDQKQQMVEALARMAASGRSSF